LRILTVRHLSAYRYAKPVGLGEHWMMFRPRESHDLNLLSSSLVIRPQPVSLRWLHDVFDNSVAVAGFTGKTTELVFDSTVTIEQLEVSEPDYQLEREAMLFPFAYSPEDRANLQQAIAIRYPSAALEGWAGRFAPSPDTTPAERTGTLALLGRITREIRQSLTYVRRVERGVQTPAETLARGSGTCRDFALLMMETARFLGFAARFVSGYLLVERKPDQTVGGGATHAWLQIYLPGAGWVDFDPTNGIVGNSGLIRVAVAWDPAHALPLWGTFIGPATSFVGLDVTVDVTDETSPKSD
jgi:transglutaminase-like putative cysteine protease